jgi:short-subunit dehydrogenase
MSIYGSTKAFLIHFTKCLKIEFPELDIMTLNPASVSTLMNKNKPTDALTCSSEECVRWALYDFPHDLQSDGAWKHRL